MMSTTLNKLEYLDETKGQIKTALNQFGAGITDETTFRDYTNKIEGIYNNWPKVTGSGTEITLNNTKAAKMVMDVKGNSTQETTNGYQLIPTTQEFHKYESNEITFETYPDGTCKIYGTSTAVVNAYLNCNTGHFTNANNSNFSSLSAGDYVYHATIIKGDLSHTKVRTGTTDLTGYGNDKTFTLENDITNFNLFFRINSGVTVNDEFKIMLEKGTTIHDWEPYTEGTVSPNPSYPQPIYSVGNNGSITEKIENEGGTEVQNISIPCQQPMRSIGNVKDEFVKVNDVWYERHNIREKILNGNENWSIAPSNYAVPASEDYIVFALGMYQAQKINTKYLCNSLPYYSFSSNTATFANRGELITSGASYVTLMIQILKNRLITEDVQGFKTWLSTNNIIVNFIAYTANNLPCTAEQIEVLEGLQQVVSYDTQTNINTTDTTPAYVEASALEKGGN